MLTLVSVRGLEIPSLAPWKPLTAKQATGCTAVCGSAPDLPNLSLLYGWGSFWPEMAKTVILWNPNIHYRVNKSPSSDHILEYLEIYLSKININNINLLFVIPNSLFSFYLMLLKQNWSSAIHFFFPMRFTRFTHPVRLDVIFLATVNPDVR